MTKALEMGFESEMPVEMPLIRTNTSVRPMAKRTKPTGWPGLRTWVNGGLRSRLGMTPWQR